MDIIQTDTGMDVDCSNNHLDSIIGYKNDKSI